jgi:hypothetical protein
MNSLTNALFNALFRGFVSDNTLSDAIDSSDLNSISTIIHRSKDWNTSRSLYKSAIELASKQPTVTVMSWLLSSIDEFQGSYSDFLYHIIQNENFTQLNWFLSSVTSPSCSYHQILYQALCIAIQRTNKIFVADILYKRLKDALSVFENSGMCPYFLLRIDRVENGIDFQSLTLSHNFEMIEWVFRTLSPSLIQSSTVLEKIEYMLKYNFISRSDFGDSPFWNDFLRSKSNRCTPYINREFALDAFA